MELLNQIIKSAEFLSSDNNIGAFILDNSMNIVWQNNALTRFFPFSDKAESAFDLSPTLDWRQFISHAAAMSMTETVARNVSGDRVALFITHSHSYFTCFASSGFQVGNIAVGALIHDMKSPVTIIKQSAEAITLCKDKKQKAELIEIIRRNSAKSLRMLNDILTLWYRDDMVSYFDRKPIPIADMIYLLCEDIRIHLLKTGVALEVCMDVDEESVLVDRDAIERVILNVLCNAIRHAKTKIKLHAFCKNGLAHIAMENDGPPVDDPSRIFDLFVHGETDGHGMGLYVARTLAEAHSGTLDYRDSEIGGALFELVLPISDAVCVRSATPYVPSAWITEEIEKAILERGQIYG